jgi:hypothetical protein
VFIDSLEKVRRLEFDHGEDRCDIEFLDGRRLALRFHLFTANELRTCLGEFFDTEDLCGLDLFHTRFSPDCRWNPSCERLSRAVEANLEKLQETYTRHDPFMDRAIHLAFVGRGRNGHCADHSGQVRRSSSPSSAST